MNDAANDAKPALDLPPFYVTGPGNVVRIGTEEMVYEAAAKAARDAVGADLDGKPASELADDELLCRGLRDLAERICRLNGTLTEEKYVFGVRLLGTDHENAAFRMRVWRKQSPDAHAGDKDPAQSSLPNFIFGDLEIRWHARIGREMTTNRPVSRAEIEAMLKACMDSLAATP